MARNATDNLISILDNISLSLSLSKIYIYIKFVIVYKLYGNICSLE